MTTIRSFMLGILLSLLIFSAALAQTPRDTQLPTVTPPKSQLSTPIVTATASVNKVRYVSIGEVHQTRLQVFSALGSQVYDSNFRLGNLIDWRLGDQQGTALSDGTYLFLVTVKDFSGNLIQKYGTAILEEGQVYLEQSTRAELPQPLSTALESNQLSDTLSVIDRIGATGVNRTETPTEVSAKTAKQSAQNTSESSQQTIGEEESFGSGTTNMIAKWLDGPSGTLTDSIITESGGNIGIGVVDPGAKLDILTALNANAYRATDGTITTAQFNGSGAGWMGTSSNHPFHLYSNNGAARLTVATSGNIGIGTTNPASAKLEILTAANSNAYHATDGTIITAQFNGSGAGWMGTVSNHPFHLYTANGNPQLTVATSGNVGIGTLSPSTKLEIVTAANSNAWRTTDGTHTTAQFNGSGGGWIGTVSNDPFHLYSNNGAARLTVATSGNIGIGTTSPQAMLDVAGDINVTGNIAAKYQDVAEWVPSQQQIKAGTVVILDTTRSNAVVASYRAYDTHLAGVVSAQPGLLLGEGGVGKVMVATTGRVKVKVDASRYPIKIGDLLVTSGKRGLAMKSLPIRTGRTLIHRPGTIIGKALEPLAKGEGEILVLLSLQ